MEWVLGLRTSFQSARFVTVKYPELNQANHHINEQASLLIVAQTETEQLSTDKKVDSVTSLNAIESGHFLTKKSNGMVLQIEMNHNY